MSEDYRPVHYLGRRKPVRLDTGDKTIVEQCHEETTNINKIIGRYKRGQPLPINENATYADVSNVGELMDIKLMMTDMQKNYENLPDFIKEKLPFADIGNVSDETLQGLFDDHFSAKQENDKGNTQETSAKAEGNQTLTPEKNTGNNVGEITTTEGGS